MEDARVQVGGELEGVAGPADVERLVVLLGGGHVVARREVEEVVDRPLVLLHPGRVDTEGGLLEVAGHRRDPVRVSPLVDEPLDASLGAGPDEHEDVVLARLEQLLHEEAADETGRSSHEVRHEVLAAVGSSRTSLP